VSRLLHAITTSPEDRVEIDGLRGEPLVSSVVDGVSVWSTVLPDDVSPFTGEDLLAHHRVVCAIFERVAACLPARFPTFLTSEEPLLDQLPRLQAQLERVRDACEIAVTAAWLAGEPVEGPRPGTRYLQRRARLEKLADDLERTVGTDLLEARRKVALSEKVALSLALLVNRTTAGAVIQRITRSGPDVRILVNGPWPPYSFVDGPGS
jgi:Gas vesicle synthesis protein GvpL/GvpF